MPSTPGWFTQALAAPREHHFLETVRGSIHYVTWGDRTKPGLLLLHGGGAHAEWWSFIGPLMTRHWFVVAPDLAGHGESAWRDRYPQRVFADDVMAVIEQVGFAEPPVLVGHSMGGVVGILTCALYGERLAGAVIVDTSLQRPPGTPLRPSRIYPDLESALKRFRLQPQQSVEHAFILEHLAHTSLRQVEGGFTWKRDPRVVPEFLHQSFHDYLGRARCRIALFRGEHSALVSLEALESLRAVLDSNAPLIEIPEAHHHLFIDQPLAFVAALRALLADWGHSALSEHSGRLVSESGIQRHHKPTAESTAQSEP